MCFGFMSYYPAAPQFQDCESIGDLDTCDLERSTTAKPNKKQSKEDVNSGSGATCSLSMGLLTIISVGVITVSR